MAMYLSSPQLAPPRDVVPRRQFQRDPLGALEEWFTAERDAFWLPGRQLCLADPVAARAVLANPDGLYHDTSDFFRTRRGTFGPRSAQVEIGKAYRRVLRARLETSGDELASRVVALGVESEWPDAGNRLIYGWLADLLLGPRASDVVRRTADEVVERAVLAGVRRKHSPLSRFRLRYRVARELGREVDRRRAAPTPPDDALDLLDVVVAAAPPEVDETELGEVFLSSLFAVAGSIGFTLGWTVFLLGTHRLVASEPRWAVREALRLWPVAWLLGRRPTVAHTVAGIRVTPEDEVVVCPYLVHRHPKYWQHPTEFVPERWATQTELRAYMPFGRGPHTCAAAAISLEIVEALLPILLVGSRWTVETIDHRPRVDAALAPPRFVLRRPARGVVKSIERR